MHTAANIRPLHLSTLTSGLCCGQKAAEQDTRQNPGCISRPVQPFAAAPCNNIFLKKLYEAAPSQGYHGNNPPVGLAAAAGPDQRPGRKQPCMHPLVGRKGRRPAHIRKGSARQQAKQKNKKSRHYDRDPFFSFSVQNVHPAVFISLPWRCSRRHSSGRRAGQCR